MKESVIPVTVLREFLRKTSLFEVLYGESEGFNLF